MRKIQVPLNVKPTLLDGIRTLDEFGAPYVLIGGLARAFLGQARATRDVDFSVWLENDDVIVKLLAAFKKNRIVPMFSDAEEFARKYRLIALLDEKANIKIDLALGLTPFDELVVERARKFTVPGSRLIARVPTAEDFIVMKAVANRPHDTADIYEVLQMNTGLDEKYILKWTRYHAQLLDSPDLVTSIKAILKSYGRNTKPSVLQRSRRKK